MTSGFLQSRINNTWHFLWIFWAGHYGNEWHLTGPLWWLLPVYRELFLIGCPKSNFLLHVPVQKLAHWLSCRLQSHLIVTYSQTLLLTNTHRLTNKRQIVNLGELEVHSYSFPEKWNDSLNHYLNKYIQINRSR